MALKKKKGGGEGGANWMDTYGDMVTLLLCFFVLLYSMSTIDQEKWMLIVQSFNKTALVSTDDTPRGPEGDGEQEDGGGMPATTEMDSAMEELYEFLQTYAASASGDGEDSSKITVSQGDGLIYLAFDSSVFFNGDKSDLRPEGKAILDDIIPALEEKHPGVANPRWHALKLLEGDKEVTGQYPLELPGLGEKDYESRIINEKYAFIDEIVEEVLLHKQRQDRLTEKLDGALTHRVWGIPIFLGIMALVFFLTFTVGDWIKGYFEHTIDALSLLAGRGMSAMGVADIVQSLVIDGVIGGVGTIVTFLPNIFILFLALAFLEDSGYMARVAYVMEGVMSRLGLSGKAFIPMLLGFGCTVPALMASRALESKRDRYKVMLVTPFMSCNARLTIYILFSEMFFGSYAMLAAYSMYLIGIVVAMLVSVSLHLLDRKREVNYLLIELPEYKMPDARTVAIYVWDKVKDYLGKAGSTIFLATLLIWLLLNFGPQGYAADMSGGFGAVIGRWLVPFFAPIGLGFWQIAVALIAGISAKEVVVSSCAVLFGVVNANSPAGMAQFAQVLSGIGFGPLNAFCLMVFCLLYVPCAATLATIHKESGSWGWTAFVAAFQVAVAWIVTFLAYRVGLMIL